MRIIFLTQYYAPEIGASQRRLVHLAGAFRKQGHDVTVLTAMPSYPKGKVYDGYAGLWMSEDIDGIRVVRTFIYPSQTARLLPRLANYFSFVLSSILVGGWLVRRSDYLITESPPLFLGPAGWVLALWKRARFIFNVSDLWPESAVRLGVLGPGWMLRASEWLEAFSYRRAWLVSGQSRTIISSINERYPQVKTLLLSNGVDTKQFLPASKKAASQALLHPRAGCAAVYAGLHGLAQGLDQIVEAAGMVAGKADLEVFLMGDGPTKANLKAQAQSLSLSNLHFLDPIPGDQMPGWLAGGDIAIVPLKLFIPGAVPSKLYEAMATGLPVVLVATGEPAEVVKQHRCGIAIEPGDVVGLAEALRTLAADPALRKEMGRNGRSAAEQFFDRNGINGSFVEFLSHSL